MLSTSAGFTFNSSYVILLNMASSRGSDSLLVYGKQRPADHPKQSYLLRDSQLFRSFIGGVEKGWQG